MTVKAVRYMDEIGRIVVPKYVRKALNMEKGGGFEFDIDQEGNIRMKPVLAPSERCVICGKSVEGASCAELAPDKKICFQCAESVARAMLR